MNTKSAQGKGHEMRFQGKKLGLLLSSAREDSNFSRGLRLAEAALNGGAEVYLYCIDDAVDGLKDPRLERLAAKGLKGYACAYGARKRGLLLEGPAAFGGLGALGELIAGTDRFVCFGTAGPGGKEAGSL